MPYDSDYDKSPRKLIEEIAKLEQQLSSKKTLLDNKQRICAHVWGETKYEPVVQGGYTDPGDPPGTMGVDHRGPTYIPRTETPRWTRKCQLCEKVEATQRTRAVTEKVPEF